MKMSGPRFLVAAMCLLTPASALAYSQLAYDTCGYYYGQDDYAATKTANECVAANKEAADKVCDAYTSGVVDRTACETGLATGKADTTVSLGTNTSLAGTVGYGGGYLKDCQGPLAKALIQAKNDYDTCLSQTDWNAAEG